MPEATQGVDPKAKVFADLYPVLYAAETPISGAYVTTSWMSATIADVLSGGLAGKDVLDVGCGYGTTSAIIANFKPKRIMAVDNSEAMIELYRNVMLSDLALHNWLIEKNARPVLQDLYYPTLYHLLARRAQFQNGAFYKNGGKAEALCCSSLSLSRDSVGTFDVVIGNNFLHWPVNQRLAELRKDNASSNRSEEQMLSRAVNDALLPIADVLRDGGVAVMMEPKDFMTDDLYPDHEAALEAGSMTAHPLFKKFHETFNRLLKEGYGIDRKVPTNTGLFKNSKLQGYAEVAGLKLERLVHAENSFTCDPVKAFYVRLPMVLGGLNIPFDDKLKLGQQTMIEFDKLVTAEDKELPLQTQYFYICLRRA